MYSFTKISLSLIFIFLGFNLKAQKNNSRNIVGSGNIITKHLNTKPYDAIVVIGSMEVFLVEGNEGNISITAEDNVQDRVLVASDGKMLTISMKNNTSLLNTKKINISVPFKMVSELTLSGSGNITGKDLMISDSMAISLKGSGEIEVFLKTNSLKVELNGSGEIAVAGTTKDMNCTITGSGKLMAKKLIADQADLNIIGSGSSTVYVTSSLNGKIKGSGKIFYGGSPSINNLKVLGSGKVKSF